MPGFQILKEQLETGIVLLTNRGFLNAYTFEQMGKVIEGPSERASLESCLHV